MLQHVAHDNLELLLSYWTIGVTSCATYVIILLVGVSFWPRVFNLGHWICHLPRTFGRNLV